MRGQEKIHFFIVVPPDRSCRFSPIRMIAITILNFTLLMRIKIVSEKWKRPAPHRGLFLSRHLRMFVAFA
jgi:hypothetical protein